MSLSMPDPDFSNMSEQEIIGASTERWIAILPLGSTEQHGPHLPLETDTIIAEAVADRLRESMPDGLQATFLPAEKTGYSPEHLDYPGSLSLTFEQAIQKWISVGEKLNRLGIRKLMLLNAHGGNSPLMTIVATELRVRFNMLCVATSWSRFGYPQGLIDASEAAIDIHGGEIETSLMLAICPEKVDMAKAADFSSRQTSFLADNKWLSAYGRHAFGWKIQDLNPAGVVGNASIASAEKGNALLKHAVSGLLELLGEVDRFDMSLLEQMPDDAR